MTFDKFAAEAVFNTNGYYRKSTDYVAPIAHKPKEETLRKFLTYIIDISRPFILPNELEDILVEDRFVHPRDDGNVFTIVEPLIPSNRTSRYKTLDATLRNTYSSNKDLVKFTIKNSSTYYYLGYYSIYDEDLNPIFKCYRSISSFESERDSDGIRNIRYMTREIILQISKSLYADSANPLAKYLTTKLIPKIFQVENSNLRRNRASYATISLKVSDYFDGVTSKITPPSIETKDFDLAECVINHFDEIFYPE